MKPVTPKKGGGAKAKENTTAQQLSGLCKKAINVRVGDLLSRSMIHNIRPLLRVGFASRSLHLCGAQLPA